MFHITRSGKGSNNRQFCIHVNEILVGMANIGSLWSRETGSQG